MVDTYRYDPALWWMAEDGAQIAGVAVGVNFPDMGWVRLLGVRRPWRRQGIALALLRQAFQEFKRRGQRSVGLGVDAASPTGATELYRRAGMRIDKQFAQYRKIVRSGQ
jgi:ribosomal protein S18 acetylase RimI-like enzyme